MSNLDSNADSFHGFLSTEQRRTVEEAIGVLEQLRNSPAATTTPRDSSDMAERSRTPQVPPQRPATNRMSNSAPGHAVSAGRGAGLSLTSRLRVIDNDRPSGSGLQSLRAQNQG